MKCQYCGKDFEPHHFNQRCYCSTKCKKAAEYRRNAETYKQRASDRYYGIIQSKKIEPRKCPHCGKEFMPNRISQIYCSVRCKYDERNERRRKMKPIKCAICGEEFTPKHGRHIYCSPRCKEIAHNAQRRQKYGYQHEVKCEMCGRIFVRTVDGRRKYCSEECYRKASLERTIESQRRKRRARKYKQPLTCPASLLPPAPPPEPVKPPEPKPETKPEWRPWILENRMPTQAEMDVLLDKIFA